MAFPRVEGLFSFRLRSEFIVPLGPLRGRQEPGIHPVRDFRLLEKEIGPRSLILLGGDSPEEHPFGDQGEGVFVKKAGRKREGLILDRWYVIPVHRGPLKILNDGSVAFGPWDEHERNPNADQHCGG